MQLVGVLACLLHKIGVDASGRGDNALVVGDVGVCCCLHWGNLRRWVRSCCNWRVRRALGVTSGVIVGVGSNGGSCLVVVL